MNIILRMLQILLKKPSNTIQKTLKTQLYLLQIALPYLLKQVILVHQCGSFLKGILRTAGFPGLVATDGRSLETTGHATQRFTLNFSL